MNEELYKLLGINPESAKEKAFTQGLLGSIFQAAALSGPQTRPVSTAQALGQVGLAGMGAYESSFDKQLQEALTGLKARSMVSEMTAPKYMTIKTPSGGEQLIQIPKAGGAPAPVNIPGLDMTGKPISFDDQTNAFVRSMFGKPFEQLTQAEQRIVIDFAQAPDARQAAELKAKIAEALRDQPQTMQIPMPKTRDEILQSVISGRPTVTTPTTTPTVTPSTTTVTPPSVTPTTPTVAPPTTTSMATDLEPKMVRTSGTVQLPIKLAETPLPKNEVPVIDSKGITPKQKADLELSRSGTFTSTETALDITRRIRNSIREILENKNFNLAFGFGGETVSSIYTPAADIRAKLDQIKNQLFVEGVTTLRSMSQTGAGVGSVTEKEGARFENLRGALVQFQSADQARKELARIEKELSDTERRLTNAFGRVYGTTQFDVTPLYTPKAQGSLRDILFPR